MGRYIIGIKIADEKVSAKAIGLIRKYTDDSMSIIKSNIITHRYVLACESSDSRALQNIKRCYRELTAAKIRAELWEDLDGWERTISLTYLNNSLQTNYEISVDIDAECEEESL